MSQSTNQCLNPRCKIKNHSKKNKYKCYCLYTVYNEKNDGLAVIVDGTAKECAAVMGITLNVFYMYQSRPKKKWHIERRFIDED